MGHDTLIRCSTLHQSTARVGIFTCGPAVQVGDNAMLPASGFVALLHFSEGSEKTLQEGAIWIHPVDHLELFIDMIHVDSFSGIY